MTATAKLAPVEEPATALAQVDANPALILLGTVDRETYLAQLREEVGTDETDTTTKAGRDRLKSLAQTIRTRKAAIDRSRKEMTEGWRRKTAEVNEVGKVIIGELDTLIDQVRAPVTAWEEAEAKRVAEADAILAELEAAKIVTIGMNSAAVQERLDRIRGLNLNGEVLAARLDMATDMQREAVEFLAQALTDLKANEAQEAELRQLRAQAAANEERRQREEAERVAKERADAAAKAEAERIERAREEAAEAARREAAAAAERERQEAAAQAERERIERERKAQEEIDAANARAAAAERAQREEQERLAREQREREAIAAREAEAQRQREADIAHRAQVIENAADALTALPGMTKKLAVAVVNEIAANNVPAVRIAF